MANEGGGLVNSAIKRGLAQVVKNHPRFKGDESYLLGHLDEERIGYEMEQITGEINREQERKGVEFSDADKSQIIYHKLAQSAASGRFFDNAGKEVILRQSLEERANKGPRRRESREILEGEKYLDHVLVAFKELYSMMKTGDYAQQMPRLAQAVSTVYNMGFLGSSVELLRHYGLITDKRYEMIKKNIHSAARKGVEETEGAIAEYSGSRESNSEQQGSIRERRLRDYAAGTASAILALAGLGMILSYSSITGGAIGSTGTSPPLLGIILLFSGIALFLLNRRHGKKRK